MSAPGRTDSARDEVVLDAVDRSIINSLQGDFPLVDEPFTEVGQALGISESDLLARIGRLLDTGVLTRFGPMYHAERMGGGLSLCAMRVPEAEFDRVAGIVNGFAEVAHNYARDHALNMWFVLATETPEGVAETCRRIEAATGLQVYDMPKQEEFFVGLRFEA